MQELVAVYALDALEGEEVTEIEAHLTTCPKCRAELQDHRDTAGYLSFAGTTAPSNLWDRIAGQLEAEPPHDALVLPFQTVRDKSRLQRWRVATGVAAAVATVLIATNGVLLLQQDRRIDDIEPTSISALAERAAGAESSRIVSLRSPDGKVTADAVIRPNGTAYLLHSKLPALDGSETYQLWGIRTGQPAISLSVLGNNPKVVGFTAQLDLDTLAITIERAGGVVSSTQKPFLVGSLST